MIAFPFCVLGLDMGRIFIRQIRPLIDEMKILIDNASVQEISEGNVEGLFNSQSVQIAWRELGYREPSWSRGENAWFCQD